MPDVLTRLILEAQTGDTRKKLDEVRAAQDRLAKEVLESAASTGKATQEYKELVRQLTELKLAEAQLENQLSATNGKFADRIKLTQQQEQFDRVSQEVSLGGDVESNARTIGGLFGAFGATGAEQAIGAASEIPAVIEALPRLKEAFAGLPNTIFAAVDSLGVGGVAIAAFAGVAIAVITALSAEAQKSADKAGAYIDALRDINQEIASGALTTDEARQRIEELTAKRDEEQRLLDGLKESYDILYGSLDPVTKAQKQLADAMEDELAQQIDESTKIVNDYGGEIDNLNRALEDGSLAAGDAADAEARLAQIRTEALLQEAALEGDLTETRLRAADQSKEQIEAQIKELEIQIAAREAELEVLRASGDTSAEAVERIKQLEEEIDNLGAKADVLSEASASAPSEDELRQAREDSKAATEAATESQKEATTAQTENTQATRDKTDADKEAAREAEKAAQAQKQYADSIAQANTRYAQALEDIDTDLKDRLTDAGIEGNQELAKQQRQFDFNELKEDRQQKFELSKLRKNADREERDDLRRRDFSALANTREDNQDAVAQAKTEFKHEGQERLLEAKFQTSEITDEAQQQTEALKREAQRRQRDAEIALNRAADTARQKLGVEQQALNQSLALYQQWAQQMTQIGAQYFTGSPGGIGGNNRALNERVDAKFNRFTARNNRFTAQVEGV